jgi:hypothetical protein
VSAYEYQRRHLAMTAVALADKIEGDFIAKHGGLATWLLAQARKEASEALMALADVDPDDLKQIRNLQNIIHRHRDLTDWMAQAVETGNFEWNSLSMGDREALRATVDPQETEDA